MVEFKVGDKVRITGGFVGNAREYVGRTGVIMENNYHGYAQVIALGGDETDPLAVNEEEIEHIPTAEDIDLRDAIATLPGLEDASLTWGDGGDPIEFLYKYGASLEDLLEYYKRVEAKHQELVAALVVVRNV